MPVDVAAGHSCHIARGEQPEYRLARGSDHLAVIVGPHASEALARGGKELDCVIRRLIDRLQPCQRAPEVRIDRAAEPAGLHRRSGNAYAAPGEPGGTADLVRRIDDHDSGSARGRFHSGNDTGHPAPTTTTSAATTAICRACTCAAICAIAGPPLLPPAGSGSAR